MNRLPVVYLGSLVVDAVGSGLWTIAFPLLVLATTQSPALFGLAMAIEGVADFVASSACAPFADSWDAEAALFLLPMVSAVGSAAIALTYFVPGPKLAYIIPAVAVVTASTALYQIVFGIVLPRIVTPSAIVKANSQVSVITQTGAFISPMIGGWLYAFIGPYLLAGIDAASFVLVALASRSLPKVPRVPQVAPETLEKDRRWHIVRFIGKDPLLRQLAAASICGNLVVGLFETAIILHLRQDLKLSANVIGVIFGVQAAGSILGAALVPFLNKYIARTGAAIFTSFMTETAFLGVVYVAPGVVAFAVAITIVTGAIAAKAINLYSLRQRILAPDSAGAILSTIRALAVASLGVGTAAGGLIATWYGSRADFLVALVVAVGMTLVVRFGMIYAETR